MKTTLDLPDALVRELQRRAQQAGQNLTQAAAELLWKGLAASPSSTAMPPRASFKTHPLTGLRCIECAHAASPATEMMPQRIADALLEQEATWQHEAGR